MKMKTKLKMNVKLKINALDNEDEKRG
jgi:hypothetical protein